VIIAVDAMGGDRAPGVVVDGAIEAGRSHGLEVILVGPAGPIREALARHPSPPTDIRIVEAPDVVAMHEAPLTALRRKPRASIRVAVEQVVRGEAQAVFSAGHSGAAVLAAHAAFGLLPGTERPALAVTVPTRTGMAVLLDVGATVDCEAKHLVHFAALGSAYAESALELSNPRVGLLSIGEEAGKGNDLIREAHRQLVAARRQFIGNVEARDLFAGGADVIVCDGFTGNIVLKVGEGLVEAIEGMLREELGAELVSQVGGLLSRRAFERFRQRVDYAEYGAAPLLGVAGLMLIGHGRSSARAVASGIAMAARLARADLVSRLTAG
jgi:glycerol-3-phosphate acyltransferase PlsX